ncbi:MAG: primosomal protein N' [Flavobacteriaceae bacterium]|nr:primosomal protein N' [Flavobacteriaceae bacterium]
MNEIFSEIILPLPLPGTFTYAVPMGWELKVGQRVAVAFGKRKIYTGIVYSIHQNKPALYRTKQIESILDDEPLVLEQQIKFWEWLADYYMCTLGEVYKNAFPSALKLESDTFVKLRKEVSLPKDEKLSENALHIWQVLHHRSLISVQEAADIIEMKSVLSVLKELLDFGLIELDEKLIQKYTPKIEYYLKPVIDIEDGSLHDILDELNRAPKQRELFFKILSLFQQRKKPILASEFIKKNGGNYATLRSMAEKGIIDLFEKQSQRISEFTEETRQIEALTDVQKKAFDQIQKIWQKNDTVLLHGVTSSGKTEVYIKLIQEVLKKKKKVLYLVPEISLTTQLTQRLQLHFGNKVGIYHSKFNQNERVELWKKTLDNEYDILIGARSALFLPIQNLGLIVVDEEHEASHKQNDMRPFFHARDAALVLAKMNSAKTILGSATPALETYHHAKSNKFGYVELHQRFGNVLQPEMEIVDLRNAYKRKLMNGNVSSRLEEEIQDTFKANKQVIIFQNRRGYAPVMECKTCGHTPYCPNCDVALTFHQLTRMLKCHYCGHSQSSPNICYKCKSTDLETKGIGTEQIEEDMLRIFHNKQIARMDVDSMRKKFAFQKLLDAFDNQELDMIVGTQMISKGLDFEHVHLVGIIRADAMLNFPDFRAHERAFQRIVQVAGRAGRRSVRGKVIIQAFAAEHKILQLASNFDYQQMAQEILYERKEFLYPPFVRLIEITFKHKNQKRASKTAQFFTDSIRKYFHEKFLLGPQAPTIPRMNNQYYFKVLIKINPDQSAKKVKILLQEALVNLHQIAAFRSVRIDFNVDP